MPYPHPDDPDLEETAKTHPEVHDTEVRGAITDQVNRLCKRMGWQPIDYWDL